MTITTLRAISLATALACTAAPARAAAHRSHHHPPARGDRAVERLNQAELDRLNVIEGTYRLIPPAYPAYAGAPPQGFIVNPPPSADFVPPAYGAQMPLEPGC